MNVPDSDVKELAFALIEDALDEEDEYPQHGITIDQLKKVLGKQKSLVENLTIRWVNALSRLPFTQYIT